MNIPKKFNLLGAEIKVVLDNDYMDDQKCYGQIEYKTNTIYISDKAHGKRIDQSEIEVTFLHELSHLIMNRCGYTKLQNDEVFIDRMARALHQCLTTME